MSNEDVMHVNSFRYTMMLSVEAFVSEALEAHFFLHKHQPQ